MFEVNKNIQVSGTLGPLEEVIQHWVDLSHEVQCWEFQKLDSGREVEWLSFMFEPNFPR